MAPGASRLLIVGCEALVYPRTGSVEARRARSRVTDGIDGSKGAQPSEALLGMRSQLTLDLAVGNIPSGLLLGRVAHMPSSR